MDSKKPARVIKSKDGNGWVIHPEDRVVERPQEPVPSHSNGVYK